MTQEPVRRPSSTYKRAGRSKHRPVLVTSTEQDALVSPEQEGTGATSSSAVAVEAQPETGEQTAQPTTMAKFSARRLPGFFSTVGRKTQEETSSETDIAQARIARATRGKTPAKAASNGSNGNNGNNGNAAAKEEKTVAKPQPARGVRPARTTGGFKTRYLFGMVLYLLAANFIGIFETNAFVSAGIDRVLTTFNLFGGNIVVRTSTLAYLATLILLLVILAYFDLIPRSFSAMSGQKQPVKRGSTTSKQGDANTLARNNPPTMRQGVSGQDDDLYEEYRYNQRRAKKK